MSTKKIIKEIDEVLNEFIKGDLKVMDFEEYLALERIAQILAKHRKYQDLYKNY